MIDVQIESDRAIIHIISGALDVTYEVRPSELYRRGTGYYGRHKYARTGNVGYVFDLAGIVRSPRDDQPPYIFAGLDFEAVVRRALSKARHLERVWRNTHSRQQVSA